MKLVDQKNNIKPLVSFVIGLLGAAIAFFPLYFAWHYYVVVICFVVGTLLMGFAGLAIQSATLDLRAFTKDPLGWRAIKKANEQTTAAEANVKDISDKAS